MAADARDLRLDRMKGFLCLAMLLAHTVFSLGYEETGSTAWKLISHAVNLTAFPGFLFCFGFVSERAYLEKNDRAAVSGRLIRRFFIIVAAYYISALAAGLLTGGALTAARLTGILHFTHINGLSYLLAFALLFLVMYLFYDGLNRLLKRTLFVWLALAVSLGFAALPAIGLDLPVVGMLIKTNESAGYPLLPYFGFFLLGAWLSKNRIRFDWRVGLFAAGGFIAFAAYVLLTRTLPKRFPPALCWVLGGYLPVYALYLLSGLCKGSVWNAVLTPFGERTLYYLTASNVLLLLYENLSRRLGFVMPRLWYLPCYILLLLLCFGLMKLYQLIRKPVSK